MTYREVYGDEEALKVAAVTKLTRNLFLAAVIPGMSYQHAKAQERALAQTQVVQLADSAVASDNSKARVTNMSGLATFQKYFPAFLYGFIAMTAVRSLGDYSLLASQGESAFYFLEPHTYKRFVSLVGDSGSKSVL